MSDDKYRYYLEDLGLLLKEVSDEVLKEAELNQEDDFKLGYKMGIHRLVSLMQSQAQTFNIPLHEINLQEINEKDFLS